MFPAPSSPAPPSSSPPPLSPTFRSLAPPPFPPPSSAPPPAHRSRGPFLLLLLPIFFDLYAYI